MKKCKILLIILFSFSFNVGYCSISPKKIGSRIDVTDAVTIDSFIEKNAKQIAKKYDSESDKQYFDRLLLNKKYIKFYFPIDDPFYNPVEKCYQPGTSEFQLINIYYNRINGKLIEKRNILIFRDSYYYKDEFPMKTDIKGMVRFIGQNRSGFRSNDKDVIIKIPCDPKFASAKKKSWAWVVEGPVINNAFHHFAGNVDASIIHMYAYETYIYLIDRKTKEIINIVNYEE